MSQRVVVLAMAPLVTADFFHQVLSSRLSVCDVPDAEARGVFEDPRTVHLGAGAPPERVYRDLTQSLFVP
jgi:hypothetical protein